MEATIFDQIVKLRIWNLTDLFGDLEIAFENLSNGKDLTFVSKTQIVSVLQNVLEDPTAIQKGILKFYCAFFY